jgi:hypothetical protein
VGGSAVLASATPPALSPANSKELEALVARPFSIIQMGNMHLQPVWRYTSTPVGPQSIPATSKGKYMRCRYPKIRRMQAADPLVERQEALIYCRAVHAGMLDWYKIADAKRQLLLTLNGVFITVLSGSLLLRPEDLSARKTQLTLIAWVFILGAAVAVGYSIFCGIMCLRDPVSPMRIWINSTLTFNISIGRGACSTVQLSPSGSERWRGIRTKRKAWTS